MNLYDIDTWDKLAKEVKEVNNENVELKKAIERFNRSAMKRGLILDAYGCLVDNLCGCEYCNEMKAEYNSDFGVQVFEDIHFIRIKYETTEKEWEYYDMEVNFCPWCGRELSVPLNND